MFSNDAAVLISITKYTVVTIAPVIIFPVLRYKKLQVNEVSKNTGIDIGTKKPK